MRLILFTIYFLLLNIEAKCQDSTFVLKIVDDYQFALPYSTLRCQLDKEFELTSDDKGIIKMDWSFGDSLKISATEITGYMDTAIIFSHDTVILTAHAYCLIDSLHINDTLAIQLINKNNPKIILPSIGVSGNDIYSNDTEFEQKYGIEFWSLDCHYISPKCIERFNNETFKFLDEKYGKRWRIEIRQDVIK